MSSEKLIIYNKEELTGIRVAARAASEALCKLIDSISVGMSTKQIDDMAGVIINATGGRSAFLGYRGFPGQICISVNDEVVHGIGRVERVLQHGDVVSLDLGVELGGFYGDNAKTVILGECSDEVKRLVEFTEKSLLAGIDAAVAGNYIKDVGAAIQKVAKSASLGIVRDYVGHGCGKALHTAPEVPNYKTAARGPKLRNGIVLAIEPMLNLGSHNVKTDKDGWTVRTADASFSAHFEHMILINNDKPEILTWPIKEVKEK